MRRKPLLRFVLAAVLALGLLLPSAAAARGPVHATASRSGWGILSGSFWDLLLQVLGPVPHLKNRSQIDPDGATVAPAPIQNDNQGTIDPNG
jgi:hypothetical protein